MEILNRHHGTPPRDAVYVGRGTPLGNPFPIDGERTRDQAVEAYANWLDVRLAERDPRVLTALLGLHEDSKLLCCCAPARCHAEVIRDRWPQARAIAAALGKNSMGYAGIGSRATPDKALGTMTRVAERLRALGFTLRSGGAQGADSAFDAGAGSAAEIFLPWRGYERRQGATVALEQPADDAFPVAEGLHPAWERLKSPVRALMARNAHQVLGAGLDRPAAFVVCWTPDGAETEAERSRETGGTGLAIALASRWGVPVFNMRRPGALQRLAELLEAREHAAAAALTIEPWPWARRVEPGQPHYEVSSKGDARFSALRARLGDGRTIEEAYQLDVKGYRAHGSDWRLGKGKPPLRDDTDLWAEYLALWRRWARDNAALLDELTERARGRTLTDCFASTDISQARALATLLAEREAVNQPGGASARRNVHNPR
jgi:hypothetical protein